MAPPDYIEFGPFHLDIINVRLWRGDQHIALRPRAFAVLRYLVERPLQLVTKEELLQHIWPGTHVSHTVLRVCIREIRRALEDRADTPTYVETLGRRGYRFLQRPRTVANTLSVLERVRQNAVIVGRQQEIDHLRMGLTKISHGLRQLMLVSGEAGAGKTAIIDTFINQVPAHSDVWIGRGQCIEYSGPGEAYLPVLEALGQLGERPDGYQLIDILRQAAPTWLPHLPALVHESERAHIQSQVQGSTQARMLRELTIALERFTAQTPLVLVFEDLHWSDPSTIDLLMFLANRKEPAKLLVVGTYRPAESTMHQHPLVNALRELHGHRQCMEFTVPPLSAGQILLYVESTLGGPVSPDVAHFLAQRTEGNALFVAHLLVNLVRQGLITRMDETWLLQEPGQALRASLPEGLRPLLNKQIEQLTVADQRLLEAASVVGDMFAVAAIADAVRLSVEDAEMMCEALARQSQLIAEAGLAKWPDGTISGTYRFQHALYRQAIYERMSQGRRVMLHRQIGAQLETSFRGQEAEIASELAYHFTQGENPVLALQYYRLAVEKALKRYAPQEAITHSRSGLDLVPLLPDVAARQDHELALQTMLGTALIAVHGYMAPEVAATFERARALCQHMTPSPHLLPILSGLFSFHLTRGESKPSYPLAKQILDVAQSQQDAALLAVGHVAMSIPQCLLGQLPQSRQHLEKALAFYDIQRDEALIPLYGQDLGVVAYCYLAWVLAYLGYPEQASQQNENALALAHDRAHPFSLGFALTFATRLSQAFRQVECTQEIAATTIDMTAQHGLAHFQAHAIIVCGWAMAMAGEYAEGLAQIQEGLSMLRERGANMLIPQYHGLMGEVYQLIDKPAEGLQYLEEALSMIKQCGMAVYEPELLRIKGELLISSSKRRWAEAAELFHQAMGVARTQHATFCELRAATSLYRLSQQQGKEALARELLAAVYKGFTEGLDHLPDLQEAQSLLEV